MTQEEQEAYTLLLYTVEDLHMAHERIHAMGLESVAAEIRHALEHVRDAQRKYEGTVD